MRAADRSLPVLFLLGQLVAAAGACTAPAQDRTAAAQDRTAAARDGSAAHISEEKLREHVSFLARDELAGRDSGEPGLEVAAEYIALRFRELGLEPAGDRGGYFQYFTAPGGAAFGGLAGALVLGPGAGAERAWAPWLDAVPFGFDEEGTGAVEAPVVFAGYGITTANEEKAKGLEYDDYAGIDAKGKVVIVLRFVPRQGRGGDPFGGKSSPHAPFVAKLRNARQHGAAAVIFATPPGSPDEDIAGLAHRAAPPHGTLPALLVRTEIVGELLRAAGRDLDRAARAIDDALAPSSFELEGVRLRLETRRGQIFLRNVAARLPGEGERAEETVVVGAHYDHIGRYGNQVAPKNLGQIHNGADDNASGVAGVLELARLFAARGRAPGRALQFLCFSGEEIGLLGSRHWVTVPRRFVVRGEAARFARQAGGGGADGGGGSSGPAPAGGAAPAFRETGASLASGTVVIATGKGEGGFIEVEMPGRKGDREKEKVWVKESAVEQVAGPIPLHRVAAMVNLDMIGRAKDDAGVTALGAHSSAVFPPLLQELSRESGVPVKVGSGGFEGGGSDHWHFQRQGIPVLFFFTGMHAQYNTPDDDTGTINFQAERRILEVVRAVLEKLCAAPRAPAFNPASLAQRGGAHGGPRLGIEVEAAPGGARVATVEADGPAAKAGLSPGDVVIGLGNARIGSVEELIDAVREAPRGEPVRLKVERGGEEKSLEVVFPRRAGGIRVAFGSVPDYAFGERGVRFEDIRAGSSAADAGVKAGDVLVLWDGKEVEGVEHWTGLLGAQKPGDEVAIRIRRDGALLDLRVKLRARE